MLIYRLLILKLYLVMLNFNILTLLIFIVIILLVVRMFVGLLIYIYGQCISFFIFIIVVEL